MFSAFFRPQSLNFQVAALQESAVTDGYASYGGYDAYTHIMILMLTYYGFDAAYVQFMVMMLTFCLQVMMLTVRKPSLQTL